tara:strand:- start:134 stop:856 length:723 start_codon:yes stop_codon:yes gene_type:complete
MVSKNILQSVVSKYYLGGLFSQVKWRIKDNTLTIYAGEQGRAAKVYLKNFQFEDCELGIFDTHKLSKLLSITNGELLITAEKTHKVYTKLHIADSNFDLNYSLADIFVIPKATYYQEIEDPDVSIDLDKENIDALIKAKTALADQSNLLVKTTENLDGTTVCEFTFGDIENFSNKVTYTLQGDIKVSDLELPFNSDILKDIFSNNKDMDSGKLRISVDGMIQLNFYSEDIETEYFLLRNE